MIAEKTEQCRTVRHSSCYYRASKEIKPYDDKGIFFGHLRSAKSSENGRLGREWTCPSRHIRKKETTCREQLLINYS